MEEAMHFLDGLKDKYLHQVEQAIEDWDFQDFSPDKRCALLENEEEVNALDDPEPDSKPMPKSVRMSWVGLTPDAELADYDCADSAGNAHSYEAKLVAVCTPPGGIQGIPDADCVQRLLTQIPRLDAIKVSAAFAARLQDETAQRNWQVRAKALVLMQMLVEIKPFAGRYIPVFQTNSTLLQQIDGLRTGTHKQVIREGARKLLSLIRSNGANPVLIPKGSPAAKPHIRHVQLRSNVKPKKVVTKPAPSMHIQTEKQTTSQGTTAMNKVFRPVPVMSKGTSLVIQHPRPSLVMSPKVSNAVQASWRRRNSIQNSEHDDDNLIPFQKLQPHAGPQSIRTSWISTDPIQGRVGMAPSSITVGGAPTSSNSSRYDSGSISAFSFVQ